MLLHYLKTTFRELFRYKIQSVVSILGLTFGFMAFILGGYWYWWETHFDTFHPEADRLYCLTTEGIVKRANGTRPDLDQLHIHDREELLKQLPEIEQICSFSPSSFSLNRNGENLNFHGMQADSSFFQLFRADFIAGTYKGRVPDGQSIVLTEATARKLFGSTDCVGKEVVMGENQRPTVAGVVRNYPDNSDLLFQYLLIRTPQPNRMKRLPTYVRLQKEHDPALTRQKLARYKSRADDPWGDLHPETWKIHLRTPSEVHLTCHPELTDRIRNIRILALAGLMAFGSALMNLLVLFIGQQQRKQQKNRTYVCIGASTRSMLLKGWMELLVPMLLAYLLAFCLIELVYPYYEQYTAWNLYGSYEGVVRHISRPALFGRGSLVAGIATALFFLLTYGPMIRMLRKPASPQQIFKRGLIVGQVFIGSLFFITSLVLFRQLYFITSKEKGIDYERVIEMDLGYDTAYETDLSVLKPEITNHPYVEGATYTGENQAVFTEQGDWYASFNTYFCLDPQEKNRERKDNVLLVDPDFFSFFGLKLLSGHWITEADAHGILVNETCYRNLGIQDLTDHPVYNPQTGQAQDFKICGVINDYLYAPMQYPVQPLFFMLQTDPKFKKDMPAYRYYVRYAPGHKREVMAHLKEVASHIGTAKGASAHKYTELSELVDRFNRPERVIFSIFCSLALVCILISSFGIYSLVNLSAEQRKKEIAIRKVNGATFLHILQLFFREYLVLVIVGNAFALPFGYLLMKRWLETYAFHTGFSPFLFLLVFILTSLIVFFSVFFQVKRASEANPAEAVKAD